MYIKQVRWHIQSEYLYQKLLELDNYCWSYSWWFGGILFWDTVYNCYIAKCLTWWGISGLTDLRTEDSGKLGCRLYAADKHFELLKDFAVTGKRTLSYLSVAFLQRAECSHCKRCISYSNSVCPSVRLSVRPSHSGIVSKRRHVARCSLHRWIAKCV